LEWGTVVTQPAGDVVSGTACMTATVTNTYKSGCLKIVKIIDYTGDMTKLPDTTFTIHVTGPSWPSSSGGTDFVFVLSGGTLTPAYYCRCDLIPDQYIVTEPNVPDGWEGAIQTSPINVVPGGTCDTTVVTIKNKPTLGCTLTWGYWKTHSVYGPAAKPDKTWYAFDFDNDGIKEGPDENFFHTGITFYAILQISDKGGNAYINLAHQYIATLLTSLMESNPNTLPGSISANMTKAKNLLDAYDQQMGLFLPKNKGGNENLRNQAITLAGILGNFNEGKVQGWPHCDGENTNGPCATCQPVIKLLRS
jgi:hypothetical protein